MAVIRDIVVDCVDPGRLGALRQAVLGYEYRARRGDWCSLRHPAGVGPHPNLDKVREGKVRKDRVHLDS